MPSTERVLAGRYRLLSLLAEGGMGVVYKAERIGIGGPVVVKFLQRILAKQQGIVERFEREARATARLNHPHCVALVDFGIDEGAPYLVMEFVEGRTLAALLDEGPLPPQRAVHIVRQILFGLAHAHERGILHRDLKPANVMIVDAVGFDDFVKILDFGLAKLSGPEEDRQRDVTVHGIALGTPGYMSPEQAAGLPVDRRADIYSMGALLFHLVTGQKISEVEGIEKILRSRRRRPSVALRARGVEALSAELVRVVLLALDRDLGRRFQSADEMRSVLEKTPEAAELGLSAATNGASTSRSKRAHARKRGGGATLVILGALLGGGATAAVTTALFARAPLAPGLTRAPKSASTLKSTSASRVASAPRSAPAPTSAVAVAPPVDGSRPGAGPEIDDPKADTTPDPDDETLPPKEPAAAPHREMPEVRTVADVRMLIKKGDGDGALSALYRLRKQKGLSAQQGAEIARLIGHLYFDRRWISDALKEYRFALALEPHARADRTLVNNTVRALGERATSPRAGKILVQAVGKSALPALRRAKSSPQPLLKKRADEVAREIERRR